MWTSLHLLHERQMCGIWIVVIQVICQETKHFLPLLRPTSGSIRFRDGGKAKVIGKGAISIPGMSKLSNV